MPIRILKKDKNKSEPKKRFDPRTGEETNKPGVKDPRTIYRPKSDIETPQMRTGGLSPKQKAIASKAPPPDKIDGKDFAVLKAEKAKGRGMGLQDESVQPGKVMKAKDSKFIERRKKLSNMSEFQKRRLKLESKKMGGVMKAKMGVATDYKKYLKGLKKATDSVKKDKENKFIKRRMKLMGMPKLSKGGGADSGTEGERRSAIGVFTNKVNRYLKGAGKGAGKGMGRMTKEDIKKASSLVKGKMVGGMMQKPMGYKSGMGPAGAGGSMAGRPGGRRPMQQGPKGGIGSLPKKRNSDDLVVIFSTKDGTKLIKRSDLDNMSAPEKKMGGGMMKARRGRIVDDPKRDKRNPNRKPSTKIFDKIGDILKTPYYIRGGKKEKKMGGGMIAPSQRPGYSKGTMVKARGCKLGRTRPTKIT